MNAYFSFPVGWYVLIAFLLALWLSAGFYRKGFSKKELKQQAVFSVISLMIAFVFEFMGISLGLWSYSPGNWPVILWLAYFSAALAGYQLLKLVISRFG